ncbi:MAG: outer membrane beta-barrel protein [Bacteroidota bacterium]
MRNSLIVFLLCFIVFIPFQLDAQRKRFNPKQRFHAGVIVGANFAQIDGDNFTGYDKGGITGGLQGVALITRRVELVAELLYSQKGARVEYKDVLHPRKERILGLNYAEAPILVRINLVPNLEKNKPIELETGISIARLIQTNIEENVNRLQYSFTGVADNFRRTDINYIIGMHVGILKDFNLGLRANSSLTKVYVNENPSIITNLERRVGIGLERPYNFFRNYHLTLYASYQIY